MSKHQPEEIDIKKIVKQAVKTITYCDDISADGVYLSDLVAKIYIEELQKNKTES